MPSADVISSERPANGVPGQAVLHVRILRDVESVVVVDERIVIDAEVQCDGGDDEDEAEHDAVVAAMEARLSPARIARIRRVSHGPCSLFAASKHSCACSRIAEAAIGNSHIVPCLDLHRRAGGQDDRLLVLLDCAVEVAMLLIVEADVECADGIDRMDRRQPARK